MTDGCSAAIRVDDEVEIVRTFRGKVTKRYNDQLRRKDDPEGVFINVMNDLGDEIHAVIGSPDQVINVIKKAPPKAGDVLFTEEELDQLPDLSIVTTHDGFAHQKKFGHWYYPGYQQPSKPLRINSVHGLTVQVVGKDANK